MLKEAGMNKCNPTTTPFPIGTTLTKDDVPTTDSERDFIRKKANKMFNKHFTTYDDVRNFYRGMVSSAGWIAKQVGPSISLAHSLLGRAMHGPSVKAFKCIKHLYRYLQGQQNMGLFYKKTKDWNWRKGEFPQYCVFSDSSFADDTADRKSQGGFVATWGDSHNQCVTSWISHKSSKVCTSTHHAETAHVSYACFEVIYKLHLFCDFLGVKRTKPVVIYTDSQATVLVSGAPIRKFTPASKQFDVEDKYVVQCVEDGLVKLQHIPGKPIQGSKYSEGFPVDMMTKPLSGKMIEKYAYMLHKCDGASTFDKSTE